jgi:hypothetical protein
LERSNCFGGARRNIGQLITSVDECQGILVLKQPANRHGLTLRNWMRTENEANGLMEAARGE